MVTDHSQAGRWCLDIYLETAFAQKVCYFCIHSFGMILRCLVGIIKAGDNPTPSFPQALHVSSYAFHPQSPPTPTHLAHKPQGCHIWLYPAKL